MFIALLAVLIFELLTFGGVLTHTWLATAAIWAAIAMLCLLWQTIRGRLEPVLALGSVVVIGIACFAGPKFAIGLFAGVWAWSAARRHPRNVPKFLHALFAIGILEAFLGFYQYYVNPGWILGYHNLASVVSGTLINHNHFAGLIGMLIFIPLGFAYTAFRHGEIARSYTYLMASAFLALAMAVSLSRMGILSLLVAGLICVVLLRLRGREQEQEGEVRTGRMLGLGLAALFFAGILWIGIDVIVHRFNLLIEGDQSFNNVRLTIYRDALIMISKHPLGVGAGNFQDAFRQYQTTHPYLTYDHAHNDYLETAAEWGMIPATIFWVAVLCTLIRSIQMFISTQSDRHAGLLLACIGAICMLLAHSLGDFNLQIPSNAMIFFVFLGLAASQSELLH